MKKSTTINKNKIYTIGKKPRKRYHLNKKEILYWSNKARRYLNLPKIKININIINYCCEFNILNFDPTIPCINLAQPTSDLIIDCDSKYILNNNYKEVLVFAVFHEFAHYFQWYYYNKWTDKYFSDKYYFNFEGKHCDKKAEINANKIASILYKRLYKNV